MQGEMLDENEMGDYAKPNKKRKVSAELRSARMWSKIALVNAILATALAVAAVLNTVWYFWRIAKKKNLPSGKADVCCVSDAHVETENGVALAGRESASHAIDAAVSFTVTGKTVRVTSASDNVADFRDGDGGKAGVCDQDAVERGVGFGGDARNVLRLKPIDGAFGGPSGTVGTPGAEGGYDARKAGNDK